MADPHLIRTDHDAQLAVRVGNELRRTAENPFTDCVDPHVHYPVFMARQTTWRDEHFYS
jgi:hypothetical protein